MLHSINNLDVKKEQRRKLRKNQTLAESILWQELRNRKLGGYKFYRQFSIGMFILDFYCHQKKLAIEIDGHHHRENQNKDFERTIYLANQGIKMIRFWNYEVTQNLQKVKEIILNSLQS